MSASVVLLSIPGLRSRDVASMPRLLDLSRKGVSVTLLPSFPAVTCSIQANLTTGDAILALYRSGVRVGAEWEHGLARIGAPVDVCGASATVGASIGIAVFAPGDDTPAADLIKMADQRMYEAKQAGRGRVFPED